MQLIILKVNISNELDVVLAYKRALQLSIRLGITLANQTKFSTAVSEICRNVVEHVGNGYIQFGLSKSKGFDYLEAMIVDRGRGIGNLEQRLNPSQPGHNPAQRGNGLISSRRLVDFFDIESDFEKGTKVTLRQCLPLKAPVVTKALIEGWVHELDQDAVLSPYAEIKRQNMQLLEVLDNLRERNEVAQQRLDVISELNEQLQASNRNIQELLDERNKQNLLLHKINEDLDAFAHTVSHDLRGPLQNISGLTNAIQYCIDTNKSDEVQEMFPMLHEQTKRMEDFISSVLSYSLSGQSNVPKTETKVLDLIQEVLNLLGIDHAITLELPNELPVLLTEKVYLHQIFSNLFSNAVKYHDMAETPVIRIEYEKQADWIQFAVKDNGPGISAANKTRIFEMYETLGHSSIRKDSTGIGLSIVQKIIREKGGRIWVESNGRGAKFVFTWPSREVLELKEI